MDTLGTVRENVLQWLLEEDDPGVRYLALRDIIGLLRGDAELEAARRQAYQQGPIHEILEAMHPDGYWQKPGPGYNPKYTSTVWALILLGQLGASVKDDRRIQTACSYILEHALSMHGQFSYNGAPSSTIDCLQGNLCWSLLALECEDPRLEPAFEWMARSVTGEGIAPASEREAALRYYAYKTGPLFACGTNNKLPCAWGAAKVMLAFSRLDVDRRTALIKQAIQAGINFLLDADPATGNYPTATSGKPSSNWWKFGFPVFYVTDILQIVEAVASLGYRQDPRLQAALQLVSSKQDGQGRWALEYNYASKTYSNFGRKGQANKWVTLRAVRCLIKSYQPSVISV